MLIGLLEDDSAQAQRISGLLEKEGHAVLHRDLANSFVSDVLSQPVDLIILDWELPDKSGLEVLKGLRQELESKVPVLFTTQRDSEEDVVAALRAGADDYLVKPVGEAELLARIEALSRRSGIKSDRPLEIGPITLDKQNEQILVDQQAVKLTRKDYLVALCLIENQGKVLSREYLLKEVWGIDSQLDTRTVDVHVSRVRRSLNIGPEMGYTIRTVHGHGYRLEKTP
ncbi:DNA-binding response regulator, OmpR family, contains REC and winged-helix (wHTH) domain [Alteromonadaceae bacterium Bs31]|nr:DNA-binding response regulator, OmpR family, contains REC and winged-helix (wHTH) domain [Alteromonadaceae bacterium Bs31]